MLLLVNIREVLSFQNSQEASLLLRDNHSVPVSRRKKAELKKRLGLVF
jgi:DNA-binding LytR/AlgR family response regulator